MGLVLNRKDLGAALDVDVQTIKLWQDWGCPVESLKGGRLGHQYDLGKVFAWRLTRTADGGETVKEKRARLEAEKSELELAEMKGLVVNREDAIQSLAASVSAFRNKMRALSRKVTPLITTRERMPEIEGILRKHIDQALMELTTNEFAESIHKRPTADISGGETSAESDSKPVGRRRTKTEQ